MNVFLAGAIMKCEWHPRNGGPACGANARFVLTIAAPVGDGWEWRKTAQPMCMPHAESAREAYREIGWATIAHRISR